MRSLPLLYELNLYWCILPSLSFLAAAVVPRLTKLALRATGLEPNEFRHVLTLAPQLTALTLDSAFRSPLPLEWSAELVKEGDRYRRLFPLLMTAEEFTFCDDEQLPANDGEMMNSEAEDADDG